MASSISDGAYGYSDQQYQAGYYGDAQQYQAAEFNVPPGADAGLQSGYAGGSSNDYPGSSSHSPPTMVLVTAPCKAIRSCRGSSSNSSPGAAAPRLRASTMTWMTGSRSHVAVPRL